MLVLRYYKKKEIIVMYLSTMPIVIVGGGKNCSYKHNLQTLYLEFNKNWLTSKLHKMHNIIFE